MADDYNGFWDGVIFYGSAGLVLWGGYALYEKYWVGEEEPVEVAAAAVVPETLPRPTKDIFVAAMDSKTVWMLDSSSVKGPSEKRMAWLIKNHSNDKTTKFRETKELWLVGCNAKSYQTLTAVSYSPDGEATTLYQESSEEANLRYAIPDSNGEAVVDAICDTRFDDKKREIMVPSPN